MKTYKIAILGSGNIGCDLLAKAIKSTYLLPQLIAGRREKSKGLDFAKSLGVKTSTAGIEAILDSPIKFDVVFDATSAIDHLDHIQLLHKSGIKIINLTPGSTLNPCVPAVNLQDVVNLDYVSMITCGGQSSIPIAYALKNSCDEIDSIEVVSSISSESAGPATRLNIDEYLTATEQAIHKFSDCSFTKAILNINPAHPCIEMQTTVYAIIKNINLEKINKNINQVIKRVQKYAPGYRLIKEAFVENGRLVVMLKISGSGDYLPTYAGNLDIITSAAINVAEHQYLSKEIL